MTLTLDHLRRYAVARRLFKPTTLSRAIQRLGFVQADPIRAPTRAQDLTLRHGLNDVVPSEPLSQRASSPQIALMLLVYRRSYRNFLPMKWR